MDLWGRAADYYTLEALAEAMDRYNQTLLAVCRERAVECLDAASLIPATTRFMYDDAHFTDAGARELATRIAAYLMESPPFR